VKTAVVDLGLGNLGSVLQALVRAGGEPRLSTDPAEIARAPRVVLPGVAAFGLGIQRALNFRPALQEALKRGAPVLGICLGMQILFEEGEEDGVQPGLGLLPGRVTKLPAHVQVPHIGWQKLQARAGSPLQPAGWAYFAHSYRCEAPDEVTHAFAEHGDVRIAAVVGRGTLFGVQYHPEKSAHDGEALLRRFLALPEGSA
jgi:imidazole glycerol-phosphate synthase subunit HisH